MWTGFHALTGFCRNYWDLILVKIGAAAGMGGLNPVSFSMITDYFKPNTRPIAFGVHGTSFIFGVGLAYVFGIALTEDSSNWRQVFFISSIPGAILAIVTFFTVKEPERGSLDELKDISKPPDTTKLMLYLIKRPSLIILCISAAIGFLGANAIANFTPLFYRRIHDMPPQEISMFLAWMSPLGGLGGSFFSAIVCMILQKYTTKGYAIVCLFGAICNAPFQLASLMVEDRYLSLFFFLPASFFTFTILVPINLILIQVVPVSGRGFAVGVLGVFVTGIGSLGPLLTGILSSYNFPIFDGVENPMAIRWSLVFIHSITRIVIIGDCSLLVFVLPYDIKALENYYKENTEIEVIHESEKLIQ